MLRQSCSSTWLRVRCSTAPNCSRELSPAATTSLPRFTNMAPARRTACPLRSGLGLVLPTVEEVGDRGAVHVAHVAELASGLGVEDLAAGADHGERGNPLGDGHTILRGDVGMAVHMADPDVGDDEVLFEQFDVGRLMEVDVEHL